MFCGVYEENGFCFGDKGGSGFTCSNYTLNIMVENLNALRKPLKNYNNAHK